MEYTEAMRIVITETTKEIKEGYVKDVFDLMISKLDGVYVDQQNSPSHLSILYFGKNIFSFSNKDYIEMAKLLKEKHE